MFFFRNLKALFPHSASSKNKLRKGSSHFFTTEITEVTEKALMIQTTALNVGEAFSL